MTDPQKTHPEGLYGKYHVTRTDGDPHGRHPDCAYFVLDLHHDTAARLALATYIDACDNPVLAADLERLLMSVNETRTYR